MNDKTIQSFGKLAKAQRESEQKAEFEKATPSPDTIKELIKRGEDIGAPQYKSDGTMTFDYFLASMKVAVEYTVRHTHAGLETFQVSRREALKRGD